MPIAVQTVFSGKTAGIPGKIGAQDIPRLRDGGMPEIC
jgi:hypothetical protein